MPAPHIGSDGRPSGARRDSRRGGVKPNGEGRGYRRRNGDGEGWVKGDFAPLKNPLDQLGPPGNGQGGSCHPGPVPQRWLGFCRERGGGRMGGLEKGPLDRITGQWLPPGHRTGPSFSAGVKGPAG